MPVSTTIRPVTQTAEVAVNKASIVGIHPEAVVENGKERRIVPIIITLKKLNAIILGAFIFAPFSFIIKGLFYYLY